MDIFKGPRDRVRTVMAIAAKALDKVSGGNITPTMVTITGALAHIPIAWLIATGRHGLGALFLVIFGLFDTLDGELARRQKRTSAGGMLLDASTDRMKEVLLYSGAAYFFASGTQPKLAVWAVLACGASLCVSYVKAKGETAVRDSKLTAGEINRLFSDGLMRFEVRMAVLVLGLLADRLSIALIVIAVTSAYTAIWRLVRITTKLDA